MPEPYARDLADARMAAGILAHVLAVEGRCLDLQLWDDWLDCYLPDCVYWLPLWLDEETLTQDPDREMSLIHHTGRAGLEERVLRLRTRKTVTAMPLPRTVHMVSNVMATAPERDEIEGSAAWRVEIYDPRARKRTSNAGRAEVTLRWDGTAWKIARKTVVLLYDMLPAVVDFYGL